VPPVVPRVILALFPITTLSSPLRLIWVAFIIDSVSIVPVNEPEVAVKSPVLLTLKGADSKSAWPDHMFPSVSTLKMSLAFGVPPTLNPPLKTPIVLVTSAPVRLPLNKPVSAVKSPVLLTLKGADSKSAWPDHMFPALSALKTLLVTGSPPTLKVPVNEPPAALRSPLKVPLPFIVKVELSHLSLSFKENLPSLPR
jgi:hypothetical protein